MEIDFSTILITLFNFAILGGIIFLVIWYIYFRHNKKNTINKKLDRVLELLEKDRQ